MASAGVHHCGMEVNNFLRDWIFCIISNCSYLHWHWFLSLFHFWKLRMRNHLFKRNRSLLSSRSFWRLLLHFFLLLSSFFSVLFCSLLGLFSFFLFSFPLLFFLFLIPFEFSFGNKFSDCHGIIPVNKLLIILLINLNGLTNQWQVFELDRLLGFKFYWDGFACFRIEKSSAWLELKVLVRNPVEFNGSYGIISERKSESFGFVYTTVIKVHFIFLFIG